MGVISRARLLWRMRVQTARAECEAPAETLEIVELHQRELLRTAGLALVVVAAARRRLERQADALRRQQDALDDQGRRAVAVERDDLARIALHRKREVRRALDELEARIAELAAEQQYRYRRRTSGSPSKSTRCTPAASPSPTNESPICLKRKAAPAFCTRDPVWSPPNNAVKKESRARMP